MAARANMVSWGSRTEADVLAPDRSDSVDLADPVHLDGPDIARCLLAEGLLHAVLTNSQLIKAMLDDLYESKSSVSISRIANNPIDGKRGNAMRGVVVGSNFPTGIGDASLWLRDRTGEHYPGSAFARQYRSYEKRSEPIPGSPEAVAAGCICPHNQTGVEEGRFQINFNCKVHGAFPP